MLWRCVVSRCLCGGGFAPRHLKRSTASFMSDALKIEDLIVQFNTGASGEILKTQTTYLEVICSFQSEPSQDKFRIHYRGKREFSLGKGKFTSLELFENHVLLLKYKEPIVSVHLASLVSDRQKFREELDLVANRIYGSWSSVEDFCSPPSDWTLEKPYGILISAPLSYAEAVIEAAERIGVKLVFGHRNEPRGKMPRVLLLDEWYIIADDFGVERVE